MIEQHGVDFDDPTAAVDARRAFCKAHAATTHRTITPCVDVRRGQLPVSAAVTAAKPAIVSADRSSGIASG